MYTAYALKTIHGTRVAVDSKNNLIQAASLTGDFSILYAGKYLYGVYCFFLRQEKIYYISSIDKNGKINLSEYIPVLFQTCENRDGSTSFYFDSMYLSARKNSAFGFVPHNKSWEHFYFEETLLKIPHTPQSIFKRISDSEKTFDVAILGRYNNNNWGGSLTTIVTYVTVKELGFSCKMLKLKSHNNDKDLIYNAFCKFTKPAINSAFPLESWNKYFNNFLLCSDWSLYKKWFLPLNVRLFSWVNQNNCIISLAASFGQESGGYEKEDYPQLSELLNRFNHLSIREQSGVDLCKKIGVDHAVHLPDPIFSQGREFYLKVAHMHSHKKISEPYAAIYLLDLQPNSIRLAVSAASLLSLKPFFIVADKDNNAIQNIENFDYISNEGSRGISSWIYYCNNADYVITNSFHCICISLILGKNFLAINRPKFSPVRVMDLLNKIRLPEKFVKTEEDIAKAVNLPMDFENIEKSIKEMSQEIRDYIKKSIRKLHVQDKKRIDALRREECTGCMSCSNVCPKKCIIAARDIDTGFIYPEIDETACIHCGLCKKACPVLNKKELPKQDNAVYCGFSKNSKIRYQSTSGGFFSELAIGLLSQGNSVIYGAAYETPFRVCHIGIETKEELSKIRQSKYVQSEMQTTYSDIEKNLKQGKTVLFCGTPCQCAAVSQFLSFKNVDRKKLYLIDFICHSVNSPKAYAAYLEDIEHQNNDSISSVWFKNKEISWQRFSTRIDFKSKNQYYIKNRYEDDFYKGFLKYRLFSRPSCSSCKFKGENRFSDITLADAWKIPMNCDNTHGISTAVIHTQKGKELFSSIQDQLYFEEKKISDIPKGNVYFMSSVSPGKYDSYFYQRLAAKIPFSLILKEIESKTVLETLPEKLPDISSPPKVVESKTVLETLPEKLPDISSPPKVVESKTTLETLPEKLPDISSPPKVVKSKTASETLVKKATDFASIEKGILVRAHPTAKIELKPNAELILNHTAFSNEQTCLIEMAEGSRIIVEGKFKIYHSCRIKLFKNAVLILGNGYMNTNGIICSTKSITIGDAIIAPYCYIIDSDFHRIFENGKYINPPAPVKFSGHVWLGQNVTVLKGVTIGHGTCIGAKSLVTKDIPANSLAVGVPAKVIKSGIEWR